MSNGPSLIRFTTSRAVHPWLNFVSLTGPYTQEDFDLAKRIKLDKWLGPTPKGDKKPTAYWLFPTFSSLTPWDKAKIKLEIAKLILKEHRSLLSGTTGAFAVTIYGTCGRKASSTGGIDTITGFKFNGSPIDFAKPLALHEGTGL
jgi:hypothetical protein